MSSATDHPTVKKIRSSLSIRPKVYRHRQGFVLRGRTHRGWNVSVFDPDRQLLERARSAYRAGEDASETVLTPAWRKRNPEAWPQVTR